jgi:hypothetical protein
MELTFECSECGDTLASNKVEGDRWGDAKIKVEPCEKCLIAQYAAGKEEAEKEV